MTVTTVTTVGLDLAKNVFQVHGVDERGVAILRKQLRGDQVAVFFAKIEPCVVGLETCGGDSSSSIHMAATLEIGAVIARSQTRAWQPRGLQSQRELPSRPGLTIDAWQRLQAMEGPTQ